MHVCVCPAEGAVLYPQLRIPTHTYTDYILHFSKYSSLQVNIPYPVCGRRWDVDSERPAALLHLHGEQQRCVGHLLHLLLNELGLRGLLEVLGLGYLVHKAHDLAGPVASHIATWAEDGNGGGRGERRVGRQGVSQVHNLFTTASLCYSAPTMEGSDRVLH